MPPKKKLQPQSGDEDSVLISVDPLLTTAQDYNLPKSMIQRLSKGVLPANTQIQKDALTALLKSTTVFVSYLASNANDRAILGNHKTIKPEDVMDALREMEFENFIPRVKAEHDRFVEIQNNKRNDYRRRVKEDTLADSIDGGVILPLYSEMHGWDPNNTGANSMTLPSRPGDSSPAAKKQRMSYTSGGWTQIADAHQDSNATEDEDADATEPEEEEEDVEDDEVEDDQDDLHSNDEGADLREENHHQVDLDESEDDED